MKNKTIEFQTYLGKSCDCDGGTLIYRGKPRCRWCRKPLLEGGMVQYKPEHFRKGGETIFEKIDRLIGNK